MPDTRLAALVTHHGSYRALADHLGASPDGVRHWPKRGIPAAYEAAVTAAYEALSPAPAPEGPTFADLARCEALAGGVERLAQVLHSSPEGIGQVRADGRIPEAWAPTIRAVLDGSYRDPIDRGANVVRAWTAPYEPPTEPTAPPPVEPGPRGEHVILQAPWPSIARERPQEMGSYVAWDTMSAAWLRQVLGSAQEVRAGGGLSLLKVSRGAPRGGPRICSWAWNLADGGRVFLIAGDHTKHGDLDAMGVEFVAAAPSPFYSGAGGLHLTGDQGAICDLYAVAGALWHTKWSKRLLRGGL